MDCDLGCSVDHGRAPDRVEVSEIALKVAFACFGGKDTYARVRL